MPRNPITSTNACDKYIENRTASFKKKALCVSPRSNSHLEAPAEYSKGSPHANINLEVLINEVRGLWGFCDDDPMTVGSPVTLKTLHWSIMHPQHALETSRNILQEAAIKENREIRQEGR